MFGLYDASQMMAGPLKQYWHVIAVILGILIILLGILRLLGLLPRLSLNALGRIENPVIAGAVMILVGAGVLVLGLVVRR